MSRVTFGRPARNLGSASGSCGRYFALGYGFLLLLSYLTGVCDFGDDRCCFFSSYSSLSMLTLWMKILRPREVNQHLSSHSLRADIGGQGFRLALSFGHS